MGFCWDSSIDSSKDSSRNISDDSFGSFLNFFSEYLHLIIKSQRNNFLNLPGIPQWVTLPYSQIPLIGRTCVICVLQLFYHPHARCDGIISEHNRQTHQPRRVAPCRRNWQNILAEKDETNGDSHFPKAKYTRFLALLIAIC